MKTYEHPDVAATRVYQVRQYCIMGNAAVLHLAVDFLIEADIKCVICLDSGGSQVTASPHGRFKDLLPGIGRRRECQHFFTFPDVHQVKVGDQLPGFFNINFLFSGIRPFGQFNLVLLKILKSFFAGNSAVS